MIKSNDTSIIITTSGRKLHLQLEAHNLNWSFIWTDSKRGPRRSQNQTTRVYDLSNRHVLDTETKDCWLSDLPRPLILGQQTFRNGGYLVSWSLVFLMCFWELSHFQPRLCVASIFHTSDNVPPSPLLPLSFSSFIVPGSEIQPGKASPAILSSSQAQCVPAWLISKQTELMKKSQYSTYTPTGTRRSPIQVKRFKDHCWY